MAEPCELHPFFTSVFAWHLLYKAELLQSGDSPCDGRFFDTLIVGELHKSG
ncbi:Uncharacterised protein [Mycobacteroides abscessus subsp. abscessus]|nr:Uncharacterised protein [Mycobacteroides abscessus subsp. abscessus]